MNFERRGSRWGETNAAQANGAAVLDIVSFGLNVDWPAFERAGLAQRHEDQMD